MNKDLKQSLRRAVAQLPHHDARQLWEQPVFPMPEHDYISTQATAPAKRSIQRRAVNLVATFACLVVVFLGGFNWYGQNFSINAIIDLDVNPSIEITVNKKDKILSVNALNTEAALVLSGRNYRGWEIADAIETLTVAMQKEGYLNQQQNTVLLTVNGKNAAHNTALAEELSGKIRLTADREQTPTTVLRQTAPLNDSLQTQAKEYHVSAGKLRLATELATHLPEYSLDQLLALPLETLLEIMQILDDEAPTSITIDASRFVPTTRTEEEFQQQEPEMAEPTPAEPSTPTLAPTPLPAQPSSSTAPSVSTPSAAPRPSGSTAPAGSRPAINRDDDDNDDRQLSSSRNDDDDDDDDRQASSSRNDDDDDDDDDRQASSSRNDDDDDDDDDRQASSSRNDDDDDDDHDDD